MVLFHWAMQSHATRTQMLRYRSETIMTARRKALLAIVPYTLTFEARLLLAHFVFAVRFLLRNLVSIQVFHGFNTSLETF